MDITGFDTVIFSWALPDRFFHAFVNRLRDRWPGMFMDVECLDEKRDRQEIKDPAECMEVIGDERHPIIVFYRNLEMRQHLEEHGYTLAEDGEGPFSIHLRKRQGVVFQLAAVAELVSNEKRIAVPEPYPALLCSSDLLEITLVSPDDPARDKFSKTILSWIVASCV